MEKEETMSDNTRNDVLEQDFFKYLEGLSVNDIRNISLVLSDIMEKKGGKDNWFFDDDDY